MIIGHATYRNFKDNKRPEGGWKGLRKVMDDDRSAPSQ